MFLSDDLIKLPSSHHVDEIHLFPYFSQSFVLPSFHILNFFLTLGVDLFHNAGLVDSNPFFRPSVCFCAAG